MNPYLQKIATLKTRKALSDYVQRKASQSHAVAHLRRGRKSFSELLRKVVEARGMKIA